MRQRRVEGRLERRLEPRRGDEGGSIAVLTAVSVVVLMVTAAFAVDIGNTWARRGMLQKQADQAAVLAAQYLPAHGHDAQLRVAKAAAYYLTCHPVPGQDELDPSIPACPASPDSHDTAFTAYAGRLLADGNVSFPALSGPSGSYVDLRTPAARIDFGLGAAAGASGSVQTRHAIARVGTPGTVAPMTLSLNCMLDAANALPDHIGDVLGGALPINYMSGVKVPKVNGGSTLPEVTDDLLSCSRMIKSPRDLQFGTGDNLDVNLVEGLDHALEPHPALFGPNLPDPLSAGDLLSAVGGDAGLRSCSNNKLPDVIDNGGNLKNVDGSDAVPNCVMRIEGENPFKVFSNGMLGAQLTVPADTTTGSPQHVTAGRLVCTSDRPCARSFTLPGFPGLTFNDDRFEDFIVPGKESLLTSAMFFDLKTYLRNGLPVLTPQSLLTADIYSSPRFLWMPVIATPTDSPEAGQFPILTFRPVFIVQDPPEGLEPQEEVLNDVDSWVKELLGVPAGDDHGLLLDATGKTLKAIRFVTIEPGALPAVTDDYSGPITDYVGTGVKVVRLVR